MVKEIKRDKYLNESIARKGNGFIKVITGPRRSGKSYLLFTLFKNHLLASGVDENSIVEFAFDDDEFIDRLDKYFPDEPTKIWINKKRGIYVVNSKKFRSYVKEQTSYEGPYYLLLDEIQNLDSFVTTLNGFLKKPNFDVFVTGSNSHMLSTDIQTEFRGRSSQIRVRPLSFSEFYGFRGGDFASAYREYAYFGGMPAIMNMPRNEEKTDYLIDLFEETYIKDIVDRNGIEDTDSFRKLLEILASSIGSYTNPTNIENTFKSALSTIYSHQTIRRHIDACVDAFLISEALRYDVKGRDYIRGNSKFYFGDIGLRNAFLSYRQMDPNHIMENIVYNELLYRGYFVDTGTVEVNERNVEGKYVRKQLEVDFVCNTTQGKYYVQCAYRMEDETKRSQEERPLKNTGDSFKKIIVTSEDTLPWHSESGTLIVSLKDFLTNPNSLDI